MVTVPFPAIFTLRGYAFGNSVTTIHTTSEKDFRYLRYRATGNHAGVPRGARSRLSRFYKQNRARMVA